MLTDVRLAVGPALTSTKSPNARVELMAVTISQDDATL